MSERGDALIDAVAGSPWMFSSNRTSAAKEAARSICEHLGIDGEMVIRIQTCSGSCDKEAADALATLLEAAGIER